MESGCQDRSVAGDAEVLKADVADVKAEPAPVVEGDVQADG